MKIKGEELERLQQIVVKSIKIFQERKRKEIKNLKYYFSEQWSPEEIEERMQEERPIATFNHIKRFVNWLNGIIKQMDLEVKAMPRSIATEQVADIVTGIVRTALWEQRNKNAIDFAMLDALIKGVGYVYIYPDFDEDPNGQIRIRRIDPLDVYFDSMSQEPDFSDAKFVFFIDRLSEDELQMLYPNVYKQIKSVSQSWSPFDYFFIKQEDKLEFEEFLTMQQSMLESAYGKLYPVIRFREKQYYDEPALINTRTNYYITFPKLESEDELYSYAYWLNEQAGENIYKVDTVRVKRWRMVNFLGNFVLEAYDNPYGMSYYDIVPFFCYKLGRHYQSFVDDLIDPQDEFNWRKTLLIEILRDATIDSFWIPKGSMTDTEIENAQEKLKKRKQLIPIRFEYGQPIPIQSDVINKLMAIAQLEQLLRIDIKEIGGMVDALMGIVPRKLQSGKAIQALQQWGFIPFETIFSNYFFALYLIANVVWRISKYIYAKTEKVRIMLDTSGSEFQFIDLNINTEFGKINQILADDFDVYLIVKARSGDEIQEKFAELLQLRSLGIPIPDEYLILFSKVPFKYQLINMLRQAREQIQNKEETEE
ncbi:MAG: portal protein [Candidatus Aenigmatarchaeota archaeon]